MAVKLYTGDFETTTKLDDCRVWSWGTCLIDDIEQLEYGTDTDSFFQWCKEQKSCNIYFHNEKFDGEFMLAWLFRNGFTYDKKGDKPNTFNTLISNMGQWYSLEIIWNATKIKAGKKTRLKKDRTIIYDSLKKYPFPVKRIAEAFGFPIKKGEIDYHKERPICYQPTQEEWDYLKNDIQIMAMALAIQFEQGLTKITRGSDALHDYKEWVKLTFGNKTFKRWFPVLSMEWDNDLRKAYKGGFTWVNKKYQGITLYSGIVLDVNSLYPAQMYDKPMPYGLPLIYEGMYEQNDEYNLFIQKIEVTFRLKENMIPTIQVKNNHGAFKPTEYLETSVNKLGVDEPIELWLTNVDLALFEEHYDILTRRDIYGYMFKSSTEMFKGWIDKWTEVKVTSEGAKRDNAKGMLNSLYGKFGTNPDITGKYPIFDDEEIVRLKMGEQEFREPVYVPLACFVTAWGRDTTIRTAQQAYDRIIYCDTDSMHLINHEIPKEIEHIIDDKKLGYWGIESKFERAVFLRAKTYVEEIWQKNKKTGLNELFLNVKCAGMPDAIKEKVTFDNFKIGFKSNGKLLPKRTQGGIVLVDTEFTIK